MCLSGKLLKIENYCKERSNNIFWHANRCHGVLRRLLKIISTRQPQ